MPFEINWASPPKKIAPARLGLIPTAGVPANTVISRNIYGEPISIFKDDTWDLRIYGMPATLNFSTWLNKKSPLDDLARTITDEIKIIIWLSSNSTTVNAGRTRGKSYIAQALGALRCIAQIAHGLGINLSQAEHSSHFQIALRSSIVNMRGDDKRVTNNGAMSVKGLLRDLSYWQNDEKIECKVPCLVPSSELDDTLMILTRVHSIHKENRKQTPLIPSRILAKIIDESLNMMNESEAYLDQLESFIKAVYRDPLLWCENGYGYSINIKRCKRLYPELKTELYKGIKRNTVGSLATIERFGLTEYFRTHGITCLRGLSRHISELQILCSFIVHAFTGMRRSEVEVMPYDPILSKTVSGFGEINLIVSHLKKFADNNYSQATFWATSQAGVYAVSIAQKLARLQWFRQQPANGRFPTKNMPLWVGPKKRELHQAHYAAPISGMLYSTQYINSVLTKLNVAIEKEDIEELVIFDAFRGWNEEPGFEVGNSWPLTSHQYRRSVAVYASRSGMVGLPTLKSQYKQLSAVLTALYAENSAFAQNFLIDEEGNQFDNASVLSEFNAAREFNASVQFHEKVIAAESRLTGGRGTEIQLNKDRDTLPAIMANRDATLKAIKEGRLAYRETIVGGCMRKEVCESYGIDEVVPCVFECADSVIGGDGGKKLKAYAEGLQMGLDEMDEDSPPYRVTLREIERIKIKLLDEEGLKL